MPTALPLPAQRTFAPPCHLAHVRNFRAPSNSSQPFRREHVQALASAAASDIHETAAAQAAWQDQRLKHVIEAQQFDPASLEVIFEAARKMEAVRPGTPQVPTYLPRYPTHPT